MTAEYFSIYPMSRKHLVGAAKVMKYHFGGGVAVM